MNCWSQYPNYNIHATLKWSHHCQALLDLEIANCGHRKQKRRISEIALTSIGVWSH